jgi:hypothetical protein
MQVSTEKCPSNSFGLRTWDTTLLIYYTFLLISLTGVQKTKKTPLQVLFPVAGLGFEPRTFGL